MITKERFMILRNSKEKGLTRAQAMKRAGVSHPTATKYFEMSEEEFEAKMAEKAGARGTAPCVAKYDGMILEFLKDAPERSSSQVVDLIKERTGEDKLDVGSRSVYKRTEYLRELHGIPKPGRKPRQYEMVPELEPGKQMQCDFGEATMKKEGGGRVKVYFMACLLSHSRYKHLTFQDHRFRSEEVVNALQDAFGFFGGMPEEIVLDQDCTMVVSENYGKIRFTEVFQAYLDAMGLEPYVCRGADPETKGKVENVVKYVKNNFLRGRTFEGIEELNEQGLNWLRRTGNGLVHQTTKKIPAEVWSTVERDRLQPVRHYERLQAKSILTRVVRKDNTIVHNANFYQLPTGTYSKGRTLCLEIKGGRMEITDPDSREHIISHKIVAGRGHLVKAPEEMLRQRKSFREEEARISEFFGNDPAVGAFLDAVRVDKPRYVGDQFGLMAARLGQWGDIKGKVIQEMEWCMEAGELSANALIARLGLPDPEPGPEPKGQAYGESQSTQKRGLEDYARIAAGGGGERSGEDSGKDSEKPKKQ